MNHGNAKKAPVITCPFQANTSTTSSHTMLNFMGCLAFGNSSSFCYTFDRPVWNSGVTTTIILCMTLLHEFHHRNGATIQLPMSWPCWPSSACTWHAGAIHQVWD